MKLKQLFSFYNLKSNESAHPNNTAEPQVDNSAQQKLAELADIEVEKIAFDARLSTANSIFVAISGTEKDGHDFITQAITNGAIALVVENKKKVPATFEGLVVELPDTRLMLDLLASRFYQYPSSELFCFGVTGTNGKTSITYILEHILEQNGKRIGVMGTVNHRIGDKIWSSQMTTPDPVTLQQRLREFRDEAAVGAALEVSSHALEQKRAQSVHFNTVIFTNLSLDHLDYHKDMKSYFAAKQKLFTDLMWSSNKKTKFAVINTDDAYGRRLKVADGVIAWTYGKKEADFCFEIKKMDFQQTEFQIKTLNEVYTAVLPITGEHSVYNVVASIVAALSIGISIEKSIKALSSFQGVPGRLQLIEPSSEKIALVDYAHTPDALKNVLSSLNKIRQNFKLDCKIITVFGCGGDRDKTKRPLMGIEAVSQSDYVFITSDNPRTENADHIIQDIVRGIQNDYKNYETEPDRESAIRKALSLSRKGDVVLIAGKGHEDYQILGTEKIYFSDVDVTKKYLNQS